MTTDNIYHGLVTSRLANFFSKGWGDVQTYQKFVSKYFGATVSAWPNRLLRLRRKIQNRTDCLSLVRNIPKINCKLVSINNIYISVDVVALIGT